MEKNKIVDLVREEIQSYSDPEAPERMALARLITRIEKEFAISNTNESENSK